MNKNKIVALATSLLMAFSSMTTVSAKTTIYDTYDETITGSITLYKYVNNDGTSIASTGEALADTSNSQLEAIQEATGTYRMLPEQGVDFMYYKIGDFVQINDQTNNKVGMYIENLDEGFTTLLTTYGISLNKDSDDTYKISDVSNAMSSLCRATTNEITGEEATRAYVKAKGYSFEKTNKFGKTVVKDLPIGLYLISEVDWEHQSIAKHDTYWTRLEDGTVDGGDGSSYADIVSPSSPFLIQLPITNTTETTSGGKTYKTGEGWIYDVTAYPKNGSLTIHKDIVVDEYSTTHNDGNDTSKVETICDYEQVNYLNGTGASDYEQGYDDDTQLDGDNTNETLTHQIDVNMGDTVTYVVSSDVPALISDKLNKTYKITDRMTKGLNFKQLQSVTLGTDVWNGANLSLTKDSDYTLNVSDDKQTFTIELTQSGLTKLDNISSASYLYVKYDAVLTKDAEIGTDKYEYQSNDGVIDATNQNTAMLTYATDRTSEHDYYSNTCKVYTYEIQLTKTFSDTTDVDFPKVTYKVEGSRYEDINNVDLSLNAEDKTYETIKFIKESDGIYHVYDEFTDDVNNVVDVVSPNSKTGVLNLKGVDSRDYRLTELTTVEGYNLLADSIYLRLEANHNGDPKFEDGTLDHAYYWTGDEPLKLTKYDVLNSDNGNKLQEGRVFVQILDNQALSILRTGGVGTILLRTAGLLILAGGVTMYYFKKKKDEDDTSEDDSKKDDTEVHNEADI